MEQKYLNLMRDILNNGTVKPAARKNMPGTKSIFGHQFRHNLAEGFPLLTTKKVSFKNILVELLWFLKGDTNIKYLVDNGCNIWNEDAYNYYCKVMKERGMPISTNLSFVEFVSFIKENDAEHLRSDWMNFTLGDCGYQYGKTWRKWEKFGYEYGKSVVVSKNYNNIDVQYVDQISNIINTLRNNPESRRIMLTSIDPANENNLALWWCHVLAQFNCRPLTAIEREDYYAATKGYTEEERLGMNPNASDENVHEIMDGAGIPRYYLDCQMYQRSADMFLGVPFNIASYALLTHILCEMCNMIPGEMIYTYGDAHVYDNHVEACETQLKRSLFVLPKIVVNFPPNEYILDWKKLNIDEVVNDIEVNNFSKVRLLAYHSHPAIKAELSTGMVK